MTPESQTVQASPEVDEDFMRRAFEGSDLNALRMALYQNTRDESLLHMKLDSISVRGGSTTQFVLAAEERPKVIEKALEFIRGGVRTGEIPSDPEMREWFEAFTGETIDDQEFPFRRELIAFDDYPREAHWEGGKPEIPTEFSVAVIGAGFSGIVTAINLGRLGIPFTLYERQDRVGGVWSTNTYPDARVDTTNFMYQFSFEKNYPWKEHFSRQADIQTYLEHIAKKYGVWDRIRFGVEVKRAVWNEEAKSWHLELESKDGSREELDANVVVAASGLFNLPKIPDIPGIHDFEGELVHTTQWGPEHTVKGKRAAVIGNGSTGVQLLSRIAEDADHVDVYVRTPQWVIPRENYGQPITAEQRWLLDTIPYYWNWYIYSMYAMAFGTQALQERDPEWQAKGGYFNERNDALRANLTEYIKTKLDGRQDLIDQLIPDHPPYARRPIVDNNWYATLLKDHVDLVRSPIASFTKTGIVTEDGTERPADIVVAAFGFEVEKYLWPTEYIGRRGLRLEDEWEALGARAYLSVTVPGFPNLFIQYGPNSQSRSGAIFAWLEIWARYTAQNIAHMLSHGYRAMEVDRDVYERYNARMDEVAKDLIWVDPAAKDKNYYVNSHGRSSVNSPFRVKEYYSMFVPQRYEEYRFDE